MVSDLPPLWPQGWPFEPAKASEGVDLIEKHKQKLKSSDNLNLWRYMKINRFKEMLDTGKLHFTRVDCLQDRKEGTYPKRSKWCISSDDGEALRKIILVNYWHISDKESLRMWGEYATLEKGIAIRTTLSDLKVAMWPSKQVVFDDFFTSRSIANPAMDSILRPTFKKIKYLDVDSFEPDPRNFFSHFFVKGFQYEWEKELRARIIVPSRTADGLISLGVLPGFEHGIDVPIDIKRMINEVVIGPNCSKSTREHVEQLCRKYGLAGRVILSQARIE